MNGLRYVITLTLFCTSTVAVAENWSGFRGAAGTGVSREADLPLNWSMKENVAWQTDLPGRGESSPAVNSRRIFLTSQTEDDALWVIAVDRESGNIAWKKNVGSGQLAAYGPKELYAHRHNPATPCPSADEEHVCAYFGTGLLVCLDVDGNEVWRRDLVKEYGPYEIRFGMASSPRLWGDRLYIACMTKGPSYVVALDKKTGDEVWKRRVRRIPGTAEPARRSPADPAATRPRRNRIACGRFPAKAATSQPRPRTRACSTWSGKTAWASVSIWRPARCTTASGWATARIAPRCWSVTARSIASAKTACAPCLRPVRREKF